MGWVIYSTAKRLRVYLFDLSILYSEETEQLREHAGVRFNGAPPLIHRDQPDCMPSELRAEDDLAERPNPTDYSLLCKVGGGFFHRVHIVLPTYNT